jgi:hypothetical protein
MNGASVAIIESQTEKAYTHIGGEVGVVNSRWAQDHGAYKINEEEFLREWTRRNMCRHNAKRANYFVRNSGRIFDWVITDMSPEWMAENSHVHSCPPKQTLQLEVSGWKFFLGTTIFRKPTDPGPVWRWTEILKTHQVKSVADGAKWFFDHYAEICDVDDSGAVTGVVAKKSDGKYFRFNASKGVVLTAGDFNGNREMLFDINDEYRHVYESFGILNPVEQSPDGTRGMGRMASVSRDGSGIKMGVWAGGHVEVGPRAGMNTAFARVGAPGGPGFLLLNAIGERYCDEAAGGSEGAGYVSVRQPRGVITAYMDANWQKLTETMPPCHGAVDTAHILNYPALIKSINVCKPGPASGKSSLYCANTIEELIDYMGCYKGESKKKALSEIARYNELCEKGIDEDFGKDSNILKLSALKTPPFYGSIGKSDAIGAGLCQTTGLDTDADGHVLNSQLRPIKGLYAAGNNAGNRYIVQYSSPICGISLGMAMTEGYMLGELLASL